MTDLSHCCMLCAAYLPLPHPTPIVTMFTELRKVFSLWQHISEEEHDMTPYHVPSETGRKLDGPWVQIPWCAPIALMNDAWCRGNHMSEERKLLCTTTASRTDGSIIRGSCPKSARPPFSPRCKLQTTALLGPRCVESNLSIKHVAHVHKILYIV
jgi:hypothetical protein